MHGAKIGYNRSKKGIATKAKIKEPRLYRKCILVIPIWAKFGLNRSSY